MIRDLEGLPTRIKAGTAESFNEAFKALGVDLSWLGGNMARTPVTQTEKTLKIGGVTIQAIRSYTTTRSIEFDSKVTAEIRKLLFQSGYNTQKHNELYKAVNDKVGDMSPKYQLGSMGNAVTTEDLIKFLAQAKAVEDYTSQPAVRKVLAHNDAMKVLFNRHYSEIVKPE